MMVVGEVDYDGLAGEILRRHEQAEAEANITSAVRDFLIGAGLARADQIVEENPPAQASRRAVDLTALDTFVEVKRRIGTRAGFSPDERYVEQLDDYLDQSERDGQRSRMGILTDGKYWLLRWPDAGAVKTAAPNGFTLDGKDGGGWRLFDWLRDRALVSRRNIPLHDRESVEEHFGVGNPHYEKDIARLAGAVRPAQAERDGAGEAAAVGQPAAGGAGGSGGHAAGGWMTCSCAIPI